MGFLSGLVKGLSGSESDKEIFDMEHDENDEILTSDYRTIGLQNTRSYNGKYECIRCHNFFSEGDVDIDHIIPQKYGGTNSRYNLQCMCKHCNRSKKDDMSDTEADLERRKNELNAQDKEDMEFMKYVRKNYMKK